MSTNNAYFTLTDLKASLTAEGTAFLVQDATVEDGAFFWTLGDYTGQDDDINIIKADSTALSVGAWVRQGADSVRLSQGGNIADAIKYVTPLMFGATGDGTTDDTAAFQAALDTGVPNQWPIPAVAYKITDTLLIDPGAIIDGAGGAANYDASPVKIRFEPATKRDFINWRNPRTDAPYEFGGCQIRGFCVRGFGAGIDACVDLPLLYNGKIDFFAFAGLDVWVRLRRWMVTTVKGGAQGFAVAGVDFAKAGSTLDPPSDVTTTTKISAYIGQGPIAYRALDRAVTNCRITDVIESVDNACNIAKGNILDFDVFTENAPRTNAGSAWVYGKTGTAGAEQTALRLNLRDGIGYTGGANTNTFLLDLGAVRYAEISGAAYEYAYLIKTTDDTQQVVFNGLDTDNITYLSNTDGIADVSVISGAPFLPKNMLRQPGGTEFLDLPIWSRSLDLIPRERAGVPNGKIYADATRNGKIIRRDEFGNFTAPIGALCVIGTSGWTVQGGRLTPGELVQNTATTRGEPGLWLSTRFSKDAATNYSGCSTTNGSPDITNPTVGTFFLCEVGDYVTVSAGYADPVLQRRVIARSPDLTTITLDSNATSTVSGTVGVSTEAHNLIPLAQQGHREIGIDPIGNAVPNFKGEELFRTDTSNWYKSTGLTVADWKLIT